MSGGYFNYENDRLANEIFEYQVDINYGLKAQESSSKLAAQINPFEDREISELIYDVFCLMHSFDWYKECDTSEEAYRKDVEFFKEKWFGKSKQERVNNLLDVANAELETVKNKYIKELNNMLGGEE